jgi:hypothetical protein
VGAVVLLQFYADEVGGEAGWGYRVLNGEGGGEGVASNRCVRVDGIRKGDRVKLEGSHSHSGWCRVEGVYRETPPRDDCTVKFYVSLDLVTERGEVVRWYFLPDSLLLRG